MPEPVTIVAVSSGVLGLGTHLARRNFDIAKEVFDVMAGCVALVLSLPVMLLCAILIKISDRGPIFYTQVRMGRGGRPFTMIKLRTMFTNAENGSGAVWAAHRDPRVMPLCRWMRRSHVDELPQLLNVIRGEMSLVGPRPERPEILDKLEQHYPNVKRRLEVRPGITGLAQVTSGYDTTVEGFHDKLEADLEYIENRRWGMEIRILMSTFRKFNDNTAH